MIKFKNDALLKAVDGHAKGKNAIAVYADASVNTLNKLLEGETNIQLETAEKIADYLGMDLVLEFVPREMGVGV